MKDHHNSTGTEGRLTLAGLRCASCVGRAERALKATPGVSDVSVNLATGQAHFRLDRPEAMADAVAALAGAGYPAADVDTRLSVEGMNCASCVGRVEKALTGIPGVASASANLATREALVRHSPGISPQDLATAVSTAGYKASPRAPGMHHHAAGAHDHGDDPARIGRDFLIALVLTLPVFLAEMGGHLIPALHHRLYALVGQQGLWFVEFALTSAVLAWPGRQFFRIGLPALIHRRPEMNSLVALGAGAAWLYSTVATFLPGLLPESARHVYFEAAAVIVTLILLGRWLEARARGRASAAIRRLVELAPASAEVERDGAVVTLPVADLVPGDVLRLRPGERVALDGVLVEGEGAVDESMLTGEPLPVSKRPGDALTGGTMNGTSALRYRVTATGGNTVLARIIALVEQAQSAKLPVQAVVDRVTNVFVPVVIGLAILSFAIWIGVTGSAGQALVAAISVLIIACPCAMGLAVPVSIMVGTGRGAELGILFRRGDALQRLASAKVIGFDKTGTLTLGKPALTAIETAGIDRDQALRLAAAVEARSEHPLAAAIVAAATADGIDLPNATAVKATVGRGIAAEVEGHALLIGNAAALTEAGIATEPALIAAADAWTATGATPVHLSIDGRHRASFALSDPIRPDAVEAVRELHDLGLRTAMITGDVRRTAEAVGGKLGIDHVIAGVLPDGKLKAVHDLGKGTVFVGDGINDAPALAAADTGIAIGTGTDIAIESAEVVLTGGDPKGVPRALRLSRAVMGNIRQNLFWAFAYNAALIPVAMGILVPFGGPQLSPMLAAGAMALSSLFVVTNSLRLKGFR
ncbi:heavy metal translocating P-type ATPase [Paracoccus sp. CPCC 101403]|uniref:Heavy metal translocating P-type ATPase n=1 Tax=Paracoccus broussonetiae TaxID=3075834 RepID=A0ABU3EH09_9RHOB|nr:heavy metal translocating P-type ATPase [Paracoccus sp. CPCC 101403]MDT1063538.1 heavy metal translocating P-type ATPase [Paracoccus sp. CPCC 101403]